MRKKNYSELRVAQVQQRNGITLTLDRYDSNVRTSDRLVETREAGCKMVKKVHVSNAQKSKLHETEFIDVIIYHIN